MYDDSIPLIDSAAIANAYNEANKNTLSLIHYYKGTRVEFNKTIADIKDLEKLIGVHKQAALDEIIKTKDKLAKEEDPQKRQALFEVLKTQKESLEAAGQDDPDVIKQTELIQEHIESLQQRTMFSPNQKEETNRDIQTLQLKLDHALKKGNLKPDQDPIQRQSRLSRMLKGIKTGFWKVVGWKAVGL